MSSIWTPGGEKPVNRSQGSGQSTESQDPQRQPTGFGAAPETESATQAPNPEDQAQLEELRRQLAETPADVVVANHCFGLFELAALHLSLNPPQLGEAQLAIDALAAVVENLSGRLGDAEPHLKDGLNQLRLAFVQIRERSEG